MMEKLMRGPHPSIAFITLGASVALGVMLDFGILAIPAWVAYALGVVSGAGLTGMLMVYMVSWVSQTSD